MRLTERDVKILAFLKEQGVSTATQIKDLFFTTDDGFRKRIAALMRAGLVESISFSKERSQVPSRMRELQERIRSEGKAWQHAKLYRLSETLGGRKRQRAGHSTPVFWQHQIGLTDIRRYLESFLKGGIFLSDPEIKLEWSKFTLGAEVPIPDLVWRKGNIEFAIEYERTNKGSTRYFSRMVKYDGSRYKKVLYVANNNAIAEELIQVARRFPKVAVTNITSMNKVYSDMYKYRAIEEFLSEGA